MRFEVSHLTRYTYERPVLLEPLIVRLRPRSDIFQRLVSFDLAVDPQPEGMSEMVDAEGNALSQAWFLGVASMLALRTTFAVDTLRTNPYDYIVLDPDSLRVPMSYNEADRRALVHYLDPPGDPEVQAFAKDVLAAIAGGATSFLGELCQRISSMTQEVRPTGDPMPAGQTLALRRGACRDMAVLFIEACRAVGIAARFVTGYEMSDAGGNERDLHAWAEVYLNGAGWRGYGRGGPDVRELPRHQRGVDHGDADHREGADLCRERLPAGGARHPCPPDGPAAAPGLDLLGVVLILIG